jgi:ferric-dicitrate binding protein FerR (iron transport regulator)
MTDRPDGNHWDREAIARRVRELPPVEAEVGFRQRLRDSFVSGEIAPPAADRDEAPRRRIAPPLWRLLVPIAAVIAVLVVILPSRPPGLRILDVSGEGLVNVDGTGIPVQERESLSRAIRGGARVTLDPDVTLDLIVPRLAVYELRPGTRMSLPPAPGRWFGRAVACSLLVGELRLKTGSDFPGTQLTVYTPDGVVVLSGTLLSIAVDSEGTCVCVLEGVAAVGVDGDNLEEVTPGFRKIMLKNGEVSIVPVKPMHRDGVLEFDARIGGRLE